MQEDGNINNKTNIYLNISNKVFMECILKKIQKKCGR